MRAKCSPGLALSNFLFFFSTLGTLSNPPTRSRLHPLLPFAHLWRRSKTTLRSAKRERVHCRLKPKEPPLPAGEQSKFKRLESVLYYLAFKLDLLLILLLSFRSFSILFVPSLYHLFPSTAYTNEIYILTMQEIKTQSSSSESSPPRAPQLAPTVNEQSSSRSPQSRPQWAMMARLHLPCPRFDLRT